MKKKAQNSKVYALAMAAGLAAAGSANASFLFSCAELQGSSAFGDTYRIYAQFEASDVGISVLSVIELNLVAEGSFYNNFGVFAPQVPGPPVDFLQNLPPNPAFFGLAGAEGLEYDSYVTIGGSANTSLDPGFDEAGFEGSSNTIVGGWFNGNPLAPVTIDGSFRVLIAQLTVENAPHTGGSSLFVSGGGMVYIDTSGGLITEFSIILTPPPTPPAPGAMALFGLAGLTAARRRRT